MKSFTVLASILAAAAAAPVTNGPGSSFDSPGRAVPAPTPADTPECAMAKILAQGIELNIMIQMQEQVRTDDVFFALTSPGSNQRQFEIAKANLIDTINSGIAVREANQVIVPRGNPASQGIAMVSTCTPCHPATLPRSLSALITHLPSLGRGSSTWGASKDLGSGWRPECRRTFTRSAAAGLCSRHQTKPEQSASGTSCHGSDQRHASLKKN